MFRAPRKSHSKSTAHQPLINLKCDAGDDIFKHQLKQTLRKTGKGKESEAEFLYAS